MILISLLFASSFLTISNCTSYNPALFPSYDVLNPSHEVRMNPIRTTDDGLFVVNEAFLMWVDELTEEIKNLRRQGD